MCGRYAASAAADTLVETFTIERIAAGAEPLGPRFNIAPTDPVHAVMTRRDRASGEPVRLLDTPRWGLVPSWSKSPDGAARMINARVETVAEKPAYRKAFRARRCLVPADGYYEWQSEPVAGGKPRKQPWWIHPSEHAANAGLMVMAGLYEFWRRRELPDDHLEAWLTTCTIITTSATDELGRIHDRMPMQVLRADWDDWLDPEMVDPLAAHDLLHAPEPNEMTAWRVSPAVGNVRNDSPQLVLPIDDLTTAEASGE